MLKFALLFMVSCLPGIADEITFSAATTQYTDGDSGNFPPGFVVLPGFNPSPGTLEAVHLSGTFSLDGLNLEVGTDTQNATFSAVYTPSLDVSGPVPYTPPFPPLSAPGSVDVGTMTLNTSGVGSASELSAHCCDQPFGNYFAIIPIFGTATDSYDFVDLHPFTSNAQVAFLTTGYFSIDNASLTGPTADLGVIEYWFGDFTYDATVTYTYNPEPSSVILTSTVLLGLAFPARKRIARSLKVGRSNQ